MHVRSLTALLLLFASSAHAVAQNTATMAPHVSQFTGNTRGYFFTVPTDLRIVGVQVLQPPGSSNPNHNWAIVRFHNNTPPPPFNQTTNAFDQLALGLDQPSGVFAPTSVEVFAGEVIGIYGNTAAGVGTTSGLNSYTGTTQPTTTLFGATVDLFRSGMQFHLGSATSPQGMHDLFFENNFLISRVEFLYEPLAGTAYCFGDGSGAMCPCGNLGAAGHGCANGANANGGLLESLGSSSVASATLALSGSGLQPGQPGLYFQGDNATAGGNGFANGDGLRCAGGNLRRLQVRNANTQGESSTTVDIAAAGAVNAGDVKRYQLWYRNPLNSPCGTTFNLTNGVEITWQP